MAGKNFHEAQKLVLFVQKAPFSDEEKNKLVDLLSSNGMTDETIEEVHKAFNGLPKDRFKDDWQQGKLRMDLTNVLKQWQLSHGSKNFKHNK